MIVDELVDCAADPKYLPRAKASRHVLWYERTVLDHLLKCP